MAKYFAGNSLAAFFRSTSAITEDSTAGRYDTTYCSSGILITPTTNDYIESTQFSATGTIWFRYDVYCFGGAPSGTGNNGFTLMNGTTNVFHIARTSASTYQAYYWNGSAWTATGSSFSVPDSTRQTIAVKVVLGSSFEAYVAGTLLASGSGWSGGGTTVTSARIYAHSTTSTGAFVSQIMIADYDLRDSHLMPAAINGNSAANTGASSGTYTDVNETVLDESTAVIITTVGNKMGQTHASITVPSGLGISAVVVNARGRVSGGVVTDGKLGLRSGGSNFSSSAKVFNGGYEPRSNIWNSDPNGGGAWTQTSFNNAEIYEEAV